MGSNAQGDRRRGSRVPHRREIDFWIGTLHFSAYYTDISTEGIFIETIDAAAPGTRCMMRFTLPGYYRPIETEGIVTWTDPQVGMGVSFLTLTRDGYEAIEEFSLET
ncbi:MAG: PilZ domain-containing protein [Candidatus Methylomirabilales bacterium]